PAAPAPATALRTVTGAAASGPRAPAAPAAQRQPDADPGPRVSQGVPVHDRHPVRRGLADLGAEPAPGLDRHRQGLLGPAHRLARRRDGLDPGPGRLGLSLFADLST